MNSSKVKIVKRTHSNYYDFLNEKAINEVDSIEDAQLAFEAMRRNNFFAQYFVEHQDGSRVALRVKEKTEEEK